MQTQISFKSSACQIASILNESENAFINTRMCGLARLFGYLEGACLLNYLMHVLLTHPQGKTHVFKGSEILLHIGRKKKARLV